MSEIPSAENKVHPRVRLEEAKKKILSPQEYTAHPFANHEKGDTYVYQVEGGGKKVFFFGANHTNDPAHPMFAEIEKAFKAAHPDLVYIEGWQGLAQAEPRVRGMVAEKTFEEAKKEGEPFFTLKLAIDSNVAFASPEPTPLQQTTHLEAKGFSRRDIFFFYTYRQIAQYQRESAAVSDEECKKYLQRFFESMRRRSGWDSSELTVFEQKLFDELDVSDDQKYADSVDPMPWEGRPQTVYNDISRSLGRLRDEYILERITEDLKVHKSIFVVYGSGHAVVLEPAPRALLAEK